MLRGGGGEEGVERGGGKRMCFCMCVRALRAQQRGGRGGRREQQESARKEVAGSERGGGSRRAERKESVGRVFGFGGGGGERKNGGGRRERGESQGVVGGRRRKKGGGRREPGERVGLDLEEGGGERKKREEGVRGREVGSVGGRSQALDGCTCRPLPRPVTTSLQGVAPLHLEVSPAMLDPAPTSAPRDTRASELSTTAS